MSSLNMDILIQNVKELMKNNGITQEQLAEILGMSQPNVSKALSSKDKKCFTLDQVFGIADHFGVSIDQLVGNSAPKTHETNPRAIARFLTEVVESEAASYTTVEVEEEVYIVHEVYDSEGWHLDHDILNKKVSYPAIFFPEHWRVPKPFGDHDEAAIYLVNEAEQVGNATKMAPVNDFLRKYFQIYEIYKSKGIDDDAYQTVIDNYLSKLQDR